jgi:hypothetical protein
MKFVTGSVVTIKLNSGEELITKIAGEKDMDGFIKITEPVSIAPSPKGMGLVPSMFTADIKAEVRLNTNSISMYALTEDSVKMKYIEATTGITIPEKKLILG